jgi:AraC-like DNA-binding protein
MKYWYLRPPESIAAYVRTILILEGSSVLEAPDLPLVTSGMPALFCCTEVDAVGANKITRLTLFGVSVPAACWEINPTQTIIAFFFKPFAMASLFTISAAKLLNAPVDLHQWIAYKTNALFTQLLYANSTKQKIEVLEHFLNRQLQENNKVCEVIRHTTDEIMCHPTTEILPTLLQELNLNERTFQRIFKKYVGITPNHYRRICQFQLSFAQVRAKEFDTLTDVAYDNGFADQSHFIRSFKEFADTTPQHYLRSGLKEKT